MNVENTIQKVNRWLKDNIPDDQDLLVPISGGSDSALLFLLCSSIFPDRTIGVYIGTDLRQKSWFEKVGTVHYGNINDSDTNPEVGRWAYFLSVALLENRIIIGSRNKTETTLGTFSTASKVAAFLPLGNLWKHEIMEMCKWLDIPEEIIASSSVADPECGRPIKMAMIPFEQVDRFLQLKLGLIPDAHELKLTQDQIDYLDRVYQSHLYKQHLPIIGPAVAD